MEIPRWSDTMLKKLKAIETQKVSFDIVFAFLLVILFGFGLAMVFSSSSVLGMEANNDMFFFLKKSIINIVLGTVAMYVVAKIPHQTLRKYIPVINGITIVLLLLSYVPGFQVSTNGAERWIRILGFQFQPSELAKITIIFTLAHMVAIREEKGKLNEIVDREKGFFNLISKNGLLPIVGYIGLYVVLILMQKHLSATLLVLIVSVTILLVGGLNKIYFGMMSLGIVGIGIIGIIMEPFRMKRILNFTNPEADPQGAGFHIIQSWYALGSGELTGLGLGMSRQKFSWLPENHTDFIVGIIGEELGFIGIALMIICFSLLVVRGVTIAMKTKDLFSLLLVTGIITLIFSQAAINMLVVTGLFPVTGMPLPFISYGGTSTVILMMGIGLVFNVTSQMKNENQKKYESKRREKIASKM